MQTPVIERVLSATDILEMQDIVRKVPVAPYVIRYAMKFTRLTRKDKGTVPSFIKDYVTWGEVNHEIIARLLHQRGQVMGGDRLTDAYVKDNSKYTSILSLAKALEKGEARISDVRGLKPVIRLPPPRQGYESTRKTFADHGALGYRGDKIEKLLDRMLAKPSPVEAK